MKLMYILLFSCLLNVLSGQSNPLDSLINDLKKIEKDTVFVDALLDQAWVYRRIDPAVSLGLLRYLEQFEQENTFTYREDVKWYYYSLIYKEQYNFQDSEANILKYIDYHASRKDSLRLVYGHYALSNLYFDFKQLDKSMEAALEVMELNKFRPDTIQLVNMNRRIGSILAELEQFEKAMTYHDKAKALSLEKKDYYLLADVYNDIGLIYEQTGPVDSTLFYYSKYLQLATQYGTEHQQLYANYNLGAVYGDIAKYDTALQFFEKSLVLAQTTSSNLMYDFSLISLADVKTKLDDPEAALKLLNQIDIASKPINVQEDIYQKLYLAHSAESNYKEALDNHLQYKALSDSLLNQDITKQVNELNIKYESAKKDQEIINQQLELKNSRLLLLVLGGLIGIGVMAFLLWNRNQTYKANLLQEKSKNQELEIQGLRKEKQLISMQSILEGQEEERRRIARDLHDNIGSMMAAIKFKILTKKDDNTQLDQMVGQVSEEIRRISHNMTPLAFGLSGLEGAVNDLAQQLKKSGLSVSNHIRDLNRIEDKDKSIMIYRIFQELINNILKHAQATQVKMSSKLQENVLTIQVEDNGNGLPNEHWEKSNSLGLKNIKSRVSYLGGEIELDNTRGTSLNIQIPQMLS